MCVSAKCFFDIGRHQKGHPILPTWRERHHYAYSEKKTHFMSFHVGPEESSVAKDESKSSKEELVKQYAAESERLRFELSQVCQCLMQCSETSQASTSKLAEQQKAISGQSMCARRSSVS